MKSDKVYIDQILESIAKIEDFIGEMASEQFHTDAKTQSAVILQLMLIGEVSKKISEETKNTINLPWKDIAGFRDRAIHKYFEVDLDVVWTTVTDDLPLLDEALKRI